MRVAPATHSLINSRHFGDGPLGFFIMRNILAYVNFYAQSHFCALGWKFEFSLKNPALLNGRGAGAEMPPPGNAAGRPQAGFLLKSAGSSFT